MRDGGEKRRGQIEGEMRERPDGGGRGQMRERTRSGGRWERGQMEETKGNGKGEIRERGDKWPGQMEDINCEAWWWRRDGRKAKWRAETVKPDGGGEMGERPDGGQKLQGLMVEGKWQRKARWRTEIVRSDRIGEMREKGQTEETSGEAWWRKGEETKDSNMEI